MPPKNKGKSSYPKNPRKTRHTTPQKDGSQLYVSSRQRNASNTFRLDSALERAGKGSVRKVRARGAAVNAAWTANWAEKNRKSAQWAKKNPKRLAEKRGRK